MRKSPTDTRPERRALRIFAFDPMLSRAGDHRITMEIPYRTIIRNEGSFCDDRLEIVDFDGATGKHLRAVNLDDPNIAMTQGLEPVEQDPQFHQQMVYAVASKVLENFDRALGRRIRFRGGERLRLFPHAFQGRNAYFDDDLNAVLFGYFTADVDDPGPNLPGQLVFTCLSHDIIAHEVAHAALDRLQEYYKEPTNPEVPALHEAFADIVAIFQRLTLPEVVAPAIRETRGDLLDPNNRLLDLGAQFGTAAGKGGALRRLAGKPDPEHYFNTIEPHELGWILVSAVYEGFVAGFVKRTRDLVRIATGGSGRLPEGELAPDLVSRLTMECVRVAQATLSMCIRAIDYMPPVDPNFSDFLRAMVTADFELNRADDTGLRAAMIEAFRLRGIHPIAVGSLAVQSVLLESEDGKDPPPDVALAGIVGRLAIYNARHLARGPKPKSTAGRERSHEIRKTSRKEWGAHQNSSLMTEGMGIESHRVNDEPESELRQIAEDLWNWANQNSDRVGLNGDQKFALRSFRTSQRVAASGEFVIEMAVHFVQSRNAEEDLGGLRYRAGITMIANIDGFIRYLIRKPFHEVREGEIKEWVQTFDSSAGGGWSSVSRRRGPNRIVEAFSARAMDERRWR